MIWVSLQVLKVIEGSCFLHEQCIFVVSVLGQIVLLATGKNVFETLKSHSKHFDLLLLEDATESCDDSLVDKDLKLFWVG